LSVVLPDGSRADAQLEESSTDADLALIRLLNPATHSIAPPRAAQGRNSDAWFAPYRPSLSDPHLGGSVARNDVDYKCERGGVIKALQLVTTTELGDYRGYSGGPIERINVDNSAVVGVLLEQFPDRAEPRRNTNVLFAADIRDALKRFYSFDVGHLVGLLQEPEKAVSVPRQRRKRWWAGKSTQERVGATEIKLEALRRWAELGLLDHQDIRIIRARVAGSLFDD
jgi:hypothetical protein